MRRNYPTYKISDVDESHWVFIGGLTPSSATFRIRRNIPDNLQSFVVSTDENGFDVVFESDLNLEAQAGNNSSIENDYVTSVTVDNLDASTEYFYRALTYGDASKLVANGRFQTAPAEGSKESFSFVASGCSWTGSTHSVFEKIPKEHPDALFMMHLGDIHYEDLNVDSIATRMQALDRVMTYQKPQRALYANLPVVYMWDDHDWLGNNAGGDSSQIGYRAAIEQYQISMPYYDPLPSSTSMYHAFTIGSVRFIISDLRSEASGGQDDSPRLETPPQMYSPEQKAWLFEELAQAPNYDFVIWKTTKPRGFRAKQ